PVNVPLAASKLLKAAPLLTATVPPLAVSVPLLDRLPAKASVPDWPLTVPAFVNPQFTVVVPEPPVLAKVPLLVTAEAPPSAVSAPGPALVSVRPAVWLPAVTLRPGPAGRT